MTSDGTISNARPVDASATAANVNTYFIARLRVEPSCVAMFGGLGLRLGGRFRLGLECQVVDLAGEFERDIIPILEQRNTGTGIEPNVERFVLGEVIGVEFSIVFFATSLPTDKMPVLR